MSQAVKTLKEASFDDVEVFRTAARTIGNSINKAKELTGAVTGALFRLSAGLSPADAAAKIEALYTKVYEGMPKATAQGASSYRRIAKCFKEMAATGLGLPLPVYETVKAAEDALAAHVNGLPANVEARGKAEAAAARERDELEAAARRDEAERDELRLIAAEVRRMLALPADMSLSDVLATVRQMEATVREDVPA